MYKILKYYLPYILNYKKEYMLALIGIIFISISTTMTAYLLKPLLDDIFTDKNNIIYYVVPMLVILIFTLRASGRFIQDYYMVYISEHIIYNFRNKVVKYLISQDLSYLHKKDNGDLLSRIFSDLDRIRGTISSYLPILASKSITILFLTIYLFYLSPKLIIYFFIVIIIALIPLNFFNKKMRAYSLKAQKQTSTVITKLVEIFNNVELIKSTSSQEYEYKNFTKENKDYVYFNIKQSKTNAMVTPVIEIISSFGIAAILFLGIKEVLNDEITVGTFFSFIFGIMLLYEPIKIIARLTNQMQDIIIATDRFEQLFKVKPKIISGNNILKSINTLEFKNVSFSYDLNPILKNINLFLEKGKIYALIGESGAGKTTLINLIMRLYNYETGKILINNDDILSYDIKSLHKQISFVMQKPLIFQDTILNNITYGLDIDRERVFSSLKKAQALKFINSLDNGIDTILYEFGANLSGGEKQRIILARAFYRNSHMIILDEATSALDKKNDSSIQEILVNLKSDMIILIITHKIDNLKYVDKIFKLEEGELKST